jgi:hypothetical protein
MKLPAVSRQCISDCMTRKWMTSGWMPETNIFHAESLSNYKARRTGSHSSYLMQFKLWVTVVEGHVHWRTSIHTYTRASTHTRLRNVVLVSSDDHENKYIRVTAKSSPLLWPTTLLYLFVVWRNSLYCTMLWPYLIKNWAINKQKIVWNWRQLSSKPWICYILEAPAASIIRYPEDGGNDLLESLYPPSRPELV